MTQSPHKECVAMALEEVAGEWRRYRGQPYGNPFRTFEEYLDARAQALRSSPKPETHGVELRLYSANREQCGHFERNTAAEAVVGAFRNADEKDWAWLVDHLGYSGHGQFWSAVLMEVRRSLSALDQQGRSKDG